MKFLIDRCVGKRLSDWLISKGYDSLESRNLGPDPGDRTLLEWAVKDNRILITIDKDFGKFIFLEKAKHCGIVRLPDVPSSKRIQLMEQILDNHSHDLDKGAVITVRGLRIRISYSF